VIRRELDPKITDPSLGSFSTILGAGSYFRKKEAIGDLKGRKMRRSLLPSRGLEDFFFLPFFSFCSWLASPGDRKGIGRENEEEEEGNKSDIVTRERWRFSEERRGRRGQREEERGEERREEKKRVR